MRPAEVVEFVSGWIGQSANTICQFGLHQACRRPVSSSSAAADSTLVGKLFLSALGEEGGWADGWWDGGDGGGGVTYCRFRSYSCGGTVIISPLLLNSLILSYISRARGQEILQFINRSTLCKGDYYCMAYILTSLFRFFRGFTVLPHLCPCPVVPDWVLSRGSVTATQHTRHVTCAVFAYHPVFVFLLFPWRRNAER